MDNAAWDQLIATWQTAAGTAAAAVVAADFRAFDRAMRTSRRAFAELQRQLRRDPAAAHLHRPAILAAHQQWQAVAPDIRAWQTRLREAIDNVRRRRRQGRRLRCGYAGGSTTSGRNVRLRAH